MTVIIFQLYTKLELYAIHNCAFFIFIHNILLINVHFIDFYPQMAVLVRTHDKLDNFVFFFLYVLHFLLSYENILLFELHMISTYSIIIL